MEHPPKNIIRSRSSLFCEKLSNCCGNCGGACWSSCNGRGCPNRAINCCCNMVVCSCGKFELDFLANKTRFYAPEHFSALVIYETEELDPSNPAHLSILQIDHDSSMGIQKVTYLEKKDEFVVSDFNHGFAYHVKEGNCKTYTLTK